MTPDSTRQLASLLVELEASIVGVLEELPTPAWIADTLGKIRWMNAAGVVLVGPTVGSHFSRLIAPEEVNDARELFARKILGALDATVQSTTLVAIRGRTPVEVTSIPLRSNESVVGVVSLARTAYAAGVLARRRPLPRLTPRQYEVLGLLAHGESTSGIATRLGIAEETTRNHIRLLLQELDVHTRLEAVVVAFRNGWL